MTLIGGYKLASPSGTATISDSISNVVVFPISGHTDCSAMAVCLYVWDASANMWVPMLKT